MRKRFHTYTTYSIACFIVWALIFAYGLVFHLHTKNHAAFYVFCGWVIGWLSATIARKVYK
jgi:hypothetical protein